MKIVAAALCYNERPYIEEMVNFYKGQGCSLFILDNMSDDGTYEWLVENNIPTARVDTKGAFHLKQLQDKLNEHLRLINPDWLVYTGIDSYYHFSSTIRDEILIADICGYNVIQTAYYSMYNTGEKRSLPLNSTYFYSSKEGDLRMIAKYQKGKTEIKADLIKVHEPIIYISNGYFLNYGMCKTKKERENTFARRMKAWELGLTKNYGVHYQPAQSKDWKWNANDLVDIRTISHYHNNKRWYFASKKVTIIIPTMWKANTYLLVMLSKYEECDSITEVIIIDNNYEEQINLAKYKKVKVLQQKENIYVNPAWNLGVQEAKTEMVVLANDDIIIDNFESYMKFVIANLKDGMLFGFDINCFPPKRTKKLNGITIQPKLIMEHGYGVFLVLHNADYIPIPKRLKIWYGDWLLHYCLNSYSIDGIDVETPMRTTSRSVPRRKMLLRKEEKFYKAFCARKRKKL